MHTKALQKSIAAAILAGGTIAHAAGASAADMATKAPPAITAPVPYVEYWAGLDARTDSVYGYGGGVFALGGNLNQNGWLFRVSGGDGEYRYNRAVGFSQNVDFQTGDVMIGYQTFAGQARFTGYLGAYI
jgi:Cellulose biosynthesis protein BcsS